MSDQYQYRLTSTDIKSYEEQYYIHENGYGYLTSEEVSLILNKTTNLDSSVLRSIWLLSDDDEDNQLTMTEFIIALHLIDCVR